MGTEPKVVGSDPGDAYECASAPCGFCGGEMPCYCKEPADVAESQRQDDEVRNSVELPLDR